jgi:RND family efflux transporter MFP subunit
MICALALPLGAAEKSAEAEKKVERRIAVETVPVQRRTFEERLVLQGNLESGETALVPARIAGTLMKLFVDEGDRVTAGQTRLLLTDDLKLRKAVELRKLDLAVSHCSLLEKQANLEKEKASLERAEKDFARQNRLFKDEKIGTLDAVEKAESEYKKAVASVKYAESLVGLAREQERQAAAQVEMAEKDLSDATVIAPISGVVSKRFQDVGEMGAPGQPAFRIENLAKIEVSTFLPAQHYAAIKTGKTLVQVSLEGRKLGEFPVTYRSPTIDPQLRVFEVKCLLPRSFEGAAPGAMATVTVVLRREEGLGVPRKALVERGGQHVMFVLKDGRARAVTLEIGLETDGWVHVTGTGLEEGMPVVSMGQFLLNDGTAVEVHNKAQTGTAVAASGKLAKTAGER